MNSDLISRQIALEMLQIIIKKKQATGPVNFPSSVVKHFIEKLPAAQSEIIRCKDCEHWDTTWQNDFAPNYHYCPLIDGTHRDDFYCADAERRGGQDD